MTRIFLTLSIVATLALLGALGLGLSIGDASVRSMAVQSRVSVHLLTGVGAVVINVFVHALVVTYFMGTGRWLEETCNAYQLGNSWQKTSRDLKWKMYPAMLTSLLLLITTGAFGAAADPASSIGFKGWGPLSAGQVHLCFALLTLTLNMGVNCAEFVALSRNGQLVADVMGQVRRIRLEKGLEVE
jgi:ABC-type multidrug transport system fused ATPase/permease subunit